MGIRNLMLKRIMTGIMATFLSGLVCNITYAAELFEGFRIHGFLSQGYFLTSNNNIFGSSSNGGSFDFTETGLNASWTPNVDLRLAGQILFRRAGTGHEHDVEMDFALLDYTIHSTPNYRLGTRLGRLKNPFGLYNETRDVVFTRPTILLPQSIYFDRTRELSLSADGVHLYGDYRGGRGDISLIFGMGLPRSGSLDSELSLLGADYPGEISPKLSYIGRLSYELEGGKYRLAISSAWLDTRYDPELPLPRDLPPLKILFKPIIFSAQYNRDKLSLTSEYAIRPFEQQILNSQFKRSVTGESYYLQAEYRLNPNWQAILRYDALYNNRDDRDGKKFQAATGLPAHLQFAKDWTFGLRYNVTSSFLVAAEYHYVDGTAWLPIQDNPDPRDRKQRWSLFALLAGFRF